MSRVIEVLRETDHVVVTYEQDVPGTCGVLKKDWIHTQPRGDWTVLHFTRGDNVQLNEFLNVMVCKNNETLRKMCLCLLKRLDKNQHRFPYLLKILDPTFVPPCINENCRWQREFCDEMVSNTLQSVIMSCKNNNRLQNLYEELSHIVKYEN